MSAPFDGDPSHVTEMDALVAYLQILGRLTDAAYKQAAERRTEEAPWTSIMTPLVGFAKSWGLFYLIACRSASLIYTFWPSNKKRFDAAPRTASSTRTTSHGGRANAIPSRGHMTTGHEWNGIKELNTPVPRVVIFFLVVTTCSRSATGS